MKTKGLFLTVLLILSAILGYSQNATTVLQKVDNNLSAPKDIYQKLKITLIDKSGRKQTRVAEMWQKGTDKRLFRFTEPAAYKGIGILSLPGDVMYLYMPAYAKERRIASSVKNQKFAGTDMTYEDMETKKYTEKYTAKSIKTVGNQYVLELVPKTKSAYSKAVMKVNKNTYLPEYIELYDKGGNKTKTITMSFEKNGSYWVNKKLVVKDLKRNHQTVMETISVKTDTGISDDVFTIRNLKKF